MTVSPTARREQYGSWFRAWLELGEKISGEQYGAARIERDRCVGRVNTLFAENKLDALACPAMISPPHLAWSGGPDLRATQPELILTDTPEIIEGKHGPTSSGGHGKFTIPFDYSGHPTITLPIGLTAATSPPVPLAFQLVGNHLEEELLCRLATAFERAVGWEHNPLPPAVTATSSL